MTPSGRLPRDVGPNALTRALEARRARGAAVVDLTASNPTTVGLQYPPALLEPLAAPAGLRYDPAPFGLDVARRAVADDAARRGAAVDPACVVLSASTSESYAWLFKLLCDPGDAVLVPAPSYPLFEHLTRLEGVRAASYRLEYHGRWEVDLDSVRAAPPRTRAVLAVSPNNPTGSFLTPADAGALAALCRERGWAMIVDEVFADYPIAADRPGTDLAARADVLTFSLGGLSKSVGLPQLKLGWMVVGGPPRDREDALRGLELVADTFLSVGTPVQLAAPRLLSEGARVREQIQARVRANEAAARAVVAGHPSCELLRVDGGWSAVFRVPATRSEEALAVELLEREGVLVHPGYFFDFDREAFLVTSLLPPPEVFRGALARALAVAAS